jgi:hypothetical protein
MHKVIEHIVHDGVTVQSLSKKLSREIYSLLVAGENAATLSKMKQQMIDMQIQLDRIQFFLYDCENRIANPKERIRKVEIA